VSAASAWEIATQVRLGRLPGAEVLEKDFLDVIEGADYTLVPISAEVALRAGRFPSDHRDPFDRVIAAQAMHEDIDLAGQLYLYGPFVQLEGPSLGTILALPWPPISPIDNCPHGGPA
jgi:hypothetical protein